MSHLVDNRLSSKRHCYTGLVLALIALVMAWLIL
jgi:hypothetical protein